MACLKKNLLSPQASITDTADKTPTIIGYSMTVGVISYSCAGIYFYRDGFVPAPIVPFFRPLFFYKAVPQQYTS